MYYRLTCKSSTDRKLEGYSVFNSLKSIDIGQTSSCDIILPSNGRYEPVVFATIRPLDNGRWCIVRRTDCYDITINQRRLAIAQELSTKDEIFFSDGENKSTFKFEKFEDGEYDAADGLVYKRHSSSVKGLVACILLALVAVGIAAYSMLGGRTKDLRHSIPPEYANALYHIAVDSVTLLHMSYTDGKPHQETIEAIELQEAAVGTCFVTDNGLLVTARHCLEPWLDDDTWDGKSLNEKMAPDVRMAVKAETANVLAGNDEYILRSHCIVSLGSYSREFYSTDFVMDKSRDMVLQLGTDDNPLFWRTIFPMAHRRDMELGDYAYMRLPDGISRQNALHIANKEEIEKFGEPQNDHDIAVMGYPVNDNDADDNVKTNFGNAQPLELDDNKNFVGCMQMTAPINRGNSGGPVLAFIDGKLKVIGIVSKADRRADQQTFWAVPVSEIARTHGSSGKVKDNDKTFLR